MDIEVERRADVGVAQNDAHSLVVAVALDAACGKAVAQAMELDDRDVELLEQARVIVAVGAWLSGLAVVREDVERAVYHLHQRHKQLVEFRRKRYFPARVLRLGCRDDHLGVPLAAIHDIDALNGLAHLDDPFGEVDVLPCQGTDLTDAHTS